MSSQDKIIKYFQNNRDRISNDIIELTRAMVKEKTVNVVSEKLPDHPYLEFRGEESRVGKIVKDLLQKADISYE